MPIHHRKRKPLRVDGRTNSLLFLPTYFCTKHIHCDYVKMTSCNVRTFLSVFPPFQAVDILFLWKIQIERVNKVSGLVCESIKKDMDNNIMQVAKLKMQFYVNNKLRQFLLLCPWKKVINVLQNKPLLIPIIDSFLQKSPYHRFITI